MLIIAHRGFSAKYPENTLLAFEQAIQAGAKAIECDVHQVENSFIVFHDMHLEKLTGANGELASSSMSALASLRVKNSDQSIPSLQEVFALCAGKVLLNLELKQIKNPALFVQQLCDCVARAYLEAENNADHQQIQLEIVLSSFDHPLLQSIKRLLRDTDLENRIKFAALVAHLPLDNAQYAVDMQVDIAAIDAHLVSREFVQHAKENFLDVWCYTVNHNYLLARMQDIGVDAVFCDDVIWGLEAVRA